MTPEPVLGAGVRRGGAQGQRDGDGDPPTRTAGAGAGAGVGGGGRDRGRGEDNRAGCHRITMAML